MPPAEAVSVEVGRGVIMEDVRIVYSPHIFIVVDIAPAVEMKIIVRLNMEQAVMSIVCPLHQVQVVLTVLKIAAKQCLFIRIMVVPLFL